MECSFSLKGIQVYNTKSNLLVFISFIFDSSIGKPQHFWTTELCQVQLTVLIKVRQG